MKNFKTDFIRNVALIGHSGEGKTTLAEAMMFETKCIDRFGKVDDGIEGQMLFFGGGADCAREGVRTQFFEGVRVGERFFADDSRYRRFAFGHRARFVEDHAIDEMDFFQTFGIFEEDPFFGGFAGADHDGDRGGETEGAGAGDDEDGYRDV